jgi:hypothetical protein
MVVGSLVSRHFLGILAVLAFAAAPSVQADQPLACNAASIEMVGVPGASDYCDGADLDTAAIELVAVEFRAPPAIASQYINEKHGRLNRERRVCVISRIAEHHAKQSLYGPLGGDPEYGPYGYDYYQIVSDVEFLLKTC